LLRAILIIIAIGMQLFAQGANADPAPSEFVSLVHNGQFSDPSDKSWPRFPAGATVGAPEAGVPGNVLHVPFGNPPHGNAYDITFGQTNQAPIHAGDTIYFRAWMRSTEGSKIGVVYEESAPPNTKILRMTATLTPQWTEYRFADIATRDYAPGQARLTFFLGYGAGSADFADVRVEEAGRTPLAALPITYNYFDGKQNTDSWRPAALARIEKIRKGDLAIKVVDQQNRAVAGASVEVHQLRHSFHFGTAVHADLILMPGDDGDKYRESLLRMFNTAVFEGEMKWMSPPKDYATMYKAIDWLKQHDFDIRGHNLVWGGWHFLPPEMQQMNASQAMDLIHARITDMVVNRFKGDVYTWDVVNEPIGAPALWEKIGYDKIGQVYKWTREADPSIQLALNDYDLTEEESSGSNSRHKLEALVQQLRAEGAPVDVIGMQCHIRIPMTTISRVLEILDELAALHIRLEVTEYDLSVMDDTVHGQYTRDFLTAMFSHPAVQGFTVWGFWEGSQWVAAEGGAMIRRDWTPRPAAQAWEDLTKRQWWTNAAGVTNAGGDYRLRAFYGRHQITVSNGTLSKTVDIDLQPGQPANVVVQLP